MALPDSFLQELRLRAEIEGVISPYVNLKRQGRYMKGLCPFHNEKTPSFTVYTDTQSFYCFGCGAGGDAVTFIRRIENLDYMEAVKFVADRVGMQVPQDGFDDTMLKQRRRMLEANREAARFFHGSLMAKENAHALQYFLDRGISMKTIKHFGLGYAPDQWDGLLKYMTAKGYTKDELYRANLLRRKENHYYDAFKNRVMVPVIDLRGNVIAFGGRVLDDSKPKYVNTSDTLVYKKTQALFALNFAKNAKQPNLILCEGYMDAIALHQAGFEQAIACCGTALTMEQARLISRYTEEVILSQDADEAGRAAVKKSISIFQSVGLKVRVITFQGAKDPDEFIRKFGVDRFKGLLEGAANDTEYQILQERIKFDVETPDGKVGFLKEAAKILAEIRSPIERDVYAAKLSEELDVDKKALLQQVQAVQKAKYKRKEQNQMRRVVTQIPEQDKINPDKLRYPRAVNAEEELLSVLLNHPDAYADISAALGKGGFVTAFNQHIFNLLSGRLSEGRGIELSLLSGSLTPQELGYIAGLEAKGKALVNAEKLRDDCIRVIQEEKEEMNRTKPSEMNEEEFRELFRKNKDSIH